MGQAYLITTLLHDLSILTFDLWLMQVLDMWRFMDIFTS